MLSRITPIVLTIALSLGTILPGVASADTTTMRDNWESWIAQRIQQTWIDTYAEKIGLDASLVSWNDLPQELRDRFTQTFGSGSIAQ